MRVAFDNQIFLLQRFGGVSRYFVELAEALSNLEGVASKVIAPIHFNHHLWKTGSIKRRLYSPFSSDFLRFNQFVRKISNTLSNREITAWKPNLIHETFYSERDLWSEPVPRITTVHDLIREKEGTSVAKVHKKVNSIYRSHGIICVSESTRNDLLNYYNLKEDDVHRVYVGVNPKIWPNDKISKSESKEFILFVGQRDGYKNFRILLKAFSDSLSLRSNFHILAFGGNELSRSEKGEIEALGLTQNVLHRKGDDSVLSRLYRTAKLFVSSSTNEGFGSPNLEAMSSGCPVLCSDIGAHRESAGKAAHFFSSESVEHLRNNLEELLNDEAKLEELSRAGLEHVKAFTWQKCAFETMKVYERYQNN